ncbi:PEP-CTERM sorting domain-containing protein [Nostoc sp. CHAB 5844]|nr:PEP-CTERM sorting domain-containing protein [Nostoc sp. CHAB 5844]
MKTSQYLYLAISSLIVGGAMLLSSPTQAAILVTRGPNTSNFPAIGNRFVISGIDGRPVTINSITSEEFPITQIANNNTSEVSATIFGGVVQPGDFGSFVFDIQDYSEGTGGARLVSGATLLATPTGVIEEARPVLSFASSTSPGATTPFSAFNVTATGDFADESFVANTIFQVPGDQIILADASFTGTFDVSSQAIPGYVPFEQLNNFGSPTRVNVVPGGSVTVTNPQAVPEPSTLIATAAALGFGAVFKRKSLKSNNT